MAIFLAGLEYVLRKVKMIGDDPQCGSGVDVARCVVLFLNGSLDDTDRKPPTPQAISFTCVFNLVIGLECTHHLSHSVYLGRVQDTTVSIGETVCVIGAAQLVSTVIAARLSEAVDDAS
jgi:DHA2 family multidrug resistance protein